MKEIYKIDPYGNEWIKRTFIDDSEECEWRETHCRNCSALKISDYFNDQYGEMAFICSECGEKTIVS